MTATIRFRQDLFMPHVVEVTMTRPNIIRLEIHDPRPTRGAYVELDTPATGESYQVWKTHPNPSRGDQDDLGFIIGLDKNYIRFQDIAATNYFDWLVADDPSDWTVSGATVVSVHYSNDPLRTGWHTAAGQVDGGSGTPIAQQFEHHVWLVLAAPLSQAAHTIGFPTATGLRDYVFTFDDMETRCSAIRSSFIGHRASDGGKLAIVREFIPGYGTEGAVQFSETTFEVIDANGTVVWSSGTIELHTDPSEPDAYTPLTDPGGATGGFKTYASTTTEFAVTAVTNGTPVKLTVPGHTFVANDIICTGILSGTTWSGYGPNPGGSGRFVKVSNVVGDTFDCLTALTSANITGTGTYLPGDYDYGAMDKVWPTFQSSYDPTYLYWLDFSAFEPADGIYHIRIPGIGVSDPIRIDANAWLDAAGFFMRGMYNQRLGCALDGRFGYTRRVAQRNGQNGVVIYSSRMPHMWGVQGGVLGGWITEDLAGRSSWVQHGTIVDAGGEWADAGDWDVFTPHLACLVYFLQSLDWCTDLLTTNWNIPKSSDPNLFLGPGYTELDGLPDIVHEAVFAMAFRLRCMGVDGSVPSGCNGSSQGHMFNGSAEASSEDMCERFAYLPDHISNLRIAGSFAMLGRVLYELGATVLGQTYYDAAVLSFAWAEDIVAKLTPNVMTLTGGTGTYTYGETVQGAVSGATAVVYVGGTTTIKLEAITGTFQAAETVNGLSSLAARTFSSVVPNADFDKNYYYTDATGVKRSYTATGDVTNNSYIITGISSTTGWEVGDKIAGTGIPTTSVIASIDSSTQVTFRSIHDKVGPGGQIVQVNHDDATATNTGVTLTVTQYEGGWSQATYDSRINSMMADNYTLANRIFCSGALFRAAEALGETADAATYKALFNAIYTGVGQPGNNLNISGRWEYFMSPGGDSAIKDILNNTFGGFRATTSSDPLLTTTEGLEQTYPCLIFSQFQTGTMGFSSGTGVPLNYVFGSNQEQDSSRQERLKNGMQKNMHFMHGVNVLGKSYCTGFGVRAITSPLHDDGWVLGSDSDEYHPDGLIVFGPAGSNTGFVAQTRMWEGHGFPYQSACLDVAETEGDDTFDRFRIVRPYRDQRPGWHHWDTRWDISQSEFAMQDMAVAILYSLWIHGNPNI